MSGFVAVVDAPRRPAPPASRRLSARVASVISKMETLTELIESRCVPECDNKS